MLNLSDEQKKMCYADKYSHGYILTFPDSLLSIDNNTLHSESVTVEEAICDAEDFTLGGCIASSIKYEASEIIANQISGLEFTTEIAVRDEKNNTVLRIPMGTFRVNSAHLVNDKDYKLVTAYDALYDASVDVSEWYKQYFANNTTHTIKETRESLLTYLGIPFVSQIILNDEVVLKKTSDPTKGTLPGTDILRALCVINGGFGRMNRYGQFEVIYTGNTALFPEETLYPEEDLYPEDTFAYLGTSTSDEDMPEYRNVSYEEYVTQKITCLYIQTESELVQIGNDTSNPYIISSNFLLYGKTVAELRKIGQNIFDRIKDIIYRPNTTVLTGLPYMEVGDAFGLVKKTDTVESFIFSRKLTGIQALIDTYEAKGNEIRANELSVSERIDQLNGKTDVIEESVEETQENLSETQEELAGFKEETTVHFDKTDSSIEMEVSRATSAENSLSSRITITAGEISSEVTRAQNAESSLSSRITQTDSYISTKVSKGDVVSEINQSADTITLSAGRLVITTGDFTIDRSGNVFVRGEIEADSGYFGDWHLGSGAYGGMYVGDTQNPASISPGMWLGSGGIRFVSSGEANSFSVSASGVYTTDISPTVSQTYDLGSSSRKWNNVYVQNSAIETSDRALKENIEDISEEQALSLINGVTPKTYRMKNGTSGRTHWGIMSNDIESLLLEMGMSGKDFAGFVKFENEDGTDGYGLRYAEFIAPLIKYCQYLNGEIIKLKSESEGKSW